MKYYATLNSENICNVVSQLNDEIVSNNMIELSNYDTSVLGKMWTGSEWVDNPNPPKPEQTPVTNEDLSQQISEQSDLNEATQNLLLDTMSGVAEMYELLAETQSLQLDTMSGIADVYELAMTKEGGN